MSKILKDIFRRRLRSRWKSLHNAKEMCLYFWSIWYHLPRWDFNLNNCNVDEIFTCSTSGQQRNGDNGRSCTLLWGGTYVCRAVKSFGGVNDPHFTGLDGTKLDFHWQNKHFYVIYSNKHANLTNSKVRATMELNKSINKTSINAFCVRAPGSNTPSHAYMEHRSSQE